MTRSTGPVKMILQGKEKEGEGKVDKKEIGRQHIRMDRIRVGWSSSKG